jgi:flagellar motor switch protein FliN/FliY
VTRAVALARLGEAAADAVLAALAERGEDAEQGAVHAAEEAGSAFDGFELPVLASVVGDPDSFRVTLVFTTSGAARLAAAPDEGDDVEVAAASEPMSALAAAAAAATAALLGRPEPPAPETQRVSEADPAAAWEAGACVVTVPLTVCGDPAALVLAVPPELVDALAAAGPADTGACGAEGAIAGDSLREVRVRIWAELGRTRMALGRAVGLAPGEVVELDAAVDDPVVIFVNGVRLGSGHLVVGDDGEWAFRVAEVSAGPVLHRELEARTSSAAPAERQTVERKEA